jgi:hypothetical protein
MNSRLSLEHESRVADCFVVAVFLGVADIEVIGAQIRSDSSAPLEDTICFADRVFRAQDRAFANTYAGTPKLGLLQTQSVSLSLCANVVCRPKIILPKWTRKEKE